MKFNLDLDNIKYIKILYKSPNDVPNSIKAGIKSINEREIIACTKYEDGLFINTPQDITLSIICLDGLYRTKTRLKYVENAEPYVIFALEVPVGLEYQQNREYFRVNAEYDCKYIIESHFEKHIFETKTNNISANGVSITLPNHFITENDAKLILYIDKKEIETNIRYVRSEKIDEGYLLSFTYTNISENDRDCISQACIKKQLEERRSSIH